MSAAPKVSSREEETIHIRIDEFVNAWNKHDTRGMSSLYAEDGDFINPIGRIAKGRAEIEKVLKEEHTGALRDSRMSVRPENLRFLSPEIAITDHSYELTGVRDPNGKDVPTVRGHVTTVLKKAGDIWLIVADRPTVALSPPGGR
jgi:uncharacterized protein (TIGR02246 family)